MLTPPPLVVVVVLCSPLADALAPPCIVELVPPCSTEVLAPVCAEVLVPISIELLASVPMPVVAPAVPFAPDWVVVVCAIAPDAKPIAATMATVLISLFMMVLCCGSTRAVNEWACSQLHAPQAGSGRRRVASVRRRRCSPSGALPDDQFRIDQRHPRLRQHVARADQPEQPVDGHARHRIDVVVHRRQW